MDIREILMEEGDIRALSLYRSYKVGGLQLLYMYEVNSDYIAELEVKYPGITKEIKSRINI